MKKRFRLLLGMAALLMLSGCGASRQPENTYRQITQEEAAKIMAEGEDFILLDVRTLAEFAQAHIPGAICVPNETIGDEDIPELPKKDQLILVYCRSGNRSKQAAGKLAKLGYTKVLEFGGINTWTGQTVSGTQD